MFNYFCPNAVSAFDKSKNICYNIIKEKYKRIDYYVIYNYWFTDNSYLYYLSMV